MDDSRSVTSTDAPVMETVELDVGYRNLNVVENVSISLQPGITALLGENGAGKTTLVRTVAGLLRPRAGVIRSEGRPLVTRSDWRAFGTTVGYLPQSVPVLRQLTTEQFLRYIAFLKGIHRRAARAAIADALQQVDLADRARMPTTSLSGGMRRRLGLAATLVGEPRLLLLDEPTAGLDPTQRIEMRRLLLQAGRARAVLVSTHLAEDVAAIASHVIVVHDGQIAFHGRLDDFAGAASAGEVAARDVEQAFAELVNRDRG